MAKFNNRINSISHNRASEIQQPVPLMHLVLSLEMGGLEMLLVNFIKSTNQSKFLTTVCCLDEEGVLANDLKNIDVDVLSLNRKPGLDLKLIFKLARLIKEYRVQILHTHNWTAHFYGFLATRFIKSPVIIHTQHGKLDPYNWKKKFLAPFTGLYVDRFIGVSDDISNFAKLSHWVPKNKIMTILNGAEPRSLAVATLSQTQKVKRQLGIPYQTKILINVARLTDIKDHRTLLNAFAILKKDFDDIHLLIVGDGPLMEELKAYTSHLGLSESVTFAGTRLDVPKLLAIADIFALSSKSEGISVALIEAMLSNLPVVATSVGGNIEVVQDGKTGFLVPPEKPENLSEAIGILLKNQKLRKSMGEKGHLIATQNFSMEGMIVKYMDVYTSALGLNKHARLLKQA